MSCKQDNASEHEVGPIKYRRMVFPGVGDRIDQHTHDFPHATFCHKGRLLVYLDGASRVLDEGEWIDVPAEAQHAIVGLVAPSEGYCVFVNRGTDRDME